MYGTENYIELFDTTSFHVSLPEGMSGIAFSVDKIGELERLRESLNKVYGIRFVERDRELNGKMIPWFRSIHISDSTLLTNTRFYFWIMEYEKEYFDHKGYSYTDNSLTKEAYLSDKELNRTNKIIRRFSGVVMKLSNFEQDYLSKFFDHIGYQKIQENIYLTHDGFRFTFKEREDEEVNTIESIEFETTKNEDWRTVKISNEILIKLDGKKGKIRFN